MLGSALLLYGGILAVVGLGALLAWRARPRDPSSATAVRARRQGALTTAAGVLAILAFALTSPWPSDPAVRAATLPALATTLGVGVAALGERFWPRPSGERRVASLAIREGLERETAPLMRRFVAGLGVSVFVLVIGTVTAAEDGTSVERAWAEGAAGAGPYPGVAYAVPVGLAVAALAGATWWALRVVDARPALDADQGALDLAVRAASVVRVLRFAASGALLTAAGLCLSMGAALNSLEQTLRMSMPNPPQAPRDWVQNAGFALMGLAVVALVLGVRAVLSPGPPIPDVAGRAAEPEVVSP